MRRRQVSYSSDARDDLAEIGRWLTLNASEAVARRFVGRIRRAITSLEYGSERGTIRDTNRGMRVIGILSTVAIAFSVDGDAVTVHRILYNGRNWTADD